LEQLCKHTYQLIQLHQSCQIAIWISYIMHRNKGPHDSILYIYIINTITSRSDVTIPLIHSFNLRSKFRSNSPSEWDTKIHIYYPTSGAGLESNTYTTILYIQFHIINHFAVGDVIIYKWYRGAIELHILLLLYSFIFIHSYLIALGEVELMLINETYHMAMP
jgi:hypothetical protein